MYSKIDFRETDWIGDRAGSRSCPVVGFTTS
jgi:hypothetical protein